VSLENLFAAWYEFRKGKRSKPDVQAFEYSLEDSIFQLHEELVTGSYEPEKYHQFRINDPKPRLISKASVRDRLVQHALYRILYPYFDAGLSSTPIPAELAKVPTKLLLDCRPTFAR
jgi:hypothetical protein